MTGLFEWLGSILTELFPPWVIVARTHTAVRQRNCPLPAFVKHWWSGTWVRECGPGFTLRLPWIDEVWELPVTYESEDLENVEVETRDGQVYDLSPVLEWKVANPLKACFAISNYESSLKNAVRAMVVLTANRHTGRLDLEQLTAECTDQVRRIGGDFGCRCRTLTLNSAARPWTIHELRHSRGDA